MEAEEAGDVEPGYLKISKHAGVHVVSLFYQLRVPFTPSCGAAESRWPSVFPSSVMMWYAYVAGLRKFAQAENGAAWRMAMCAEGGGEETKDWHKTVPEGEFKEYLEELAGHLTNVVGGRIMDVAYEQMDREDLLVVMKFSKLPRFERSSRGFRALL